jgi:RNA polymerase-binding transcription factor
MSAAMAATRAGGLAPPVLRSLLEARWEERLGTLTELSLAYHDAAARSADRQILGETSELKQLMRETTAARRALRDTEEALARLSAGDYGRCEQCAMSIPAATLLLEPEARYCPECVEEATAAAPPGTAAAPHRTAAAPDRMAAAPPATAAAPHRALAHGTRVTGGAR